MRNEKLVLDLQLFEGDGASSEAVSGAETGAQAADAGQQKGRNPLENVRYGKQAEDLAEGQDAAAKEPEVKVTTKTAEERAAEFENLIKGDYRDLFNARVQNIVQNRLKESKAAQEKLDGLQPVLELLSSKYGVDASDIKALSKAVEDDDSYWEEEALKRGISVSSLKELKRMERENAQLKAAREQQERQARADQIWHDWMEQSERVKQIYPNFDFERETANESFTSLLKSGVDVKTAYEVVHKDEIIGGAMFQTAQVVKAKVANDIQARGKRPAENGASSQASVVTKKDVNSLTRRDREEIERRVMRGERIVF